MTLCDTGPLVALIDESDLHHEACVTTLESLGSEDLITTWPCLTEAMHLAFRVGRYSAQARIWEYIAKGLVLLMTPLESEWRRARELMRKYSDAPMGLADASLVAAAERSGIRRVFTLDRHFHAYRIHDKESFDIVPTRLAP